MAEPNYEINYDDSRFEQVESEKTAALNDLEQTYTDMTNQSDTFYQNQINASKEHAETQKKNQQAQTDFAIEQINQQKDQAKKDYTKEQSGAYVDWQKQSNQYGVDAEQRASIGMAGTGWSESAQVSMYNTYQTRYVAARESYNQAVLNYNNAIKEAQLQNSSLLAEIAYNAQKEQLSLALEGFQYKNQLLLDKVAKKTTLEQNYYQRYQDVIAQINHENSLAEQVRQHNESLALQQAQLAEEKRQFNILHPENGGTVKGGNSGSGSGSSGKSSTSGSGAIYKDSGLPGSSAFTSIPQPKTLDTKSILNATSGKPVNAKTLDALVADGYVSADVKNNKITFAKSAKAIADSMNYVDNLAKVYGKWK